MREGGRRKPQARRAEKTRSRASRTAASARPTSVKPGSPWRTRSTSTSTGKASTPSRPALYNRMTIILPTAVGPADERPPRAAWPVARPARRLQKKRCRICDSACDHAPVEKARRTRNGSPPSCPSHNAMREEGTTGKGAAFRQRRHAPSRNGSLRFSGPSGRPCRCGSSAGCCPCRPRTSRCARPWPGWHRDPRSPRSGSPASCRGCRP